MIYELTALQFAKALNNLFAILEKGGHVAEAKKFDPEVLLHSRLAPDQFNLLRQVQITCDTAKLGVSRLTGKDAPKHDDAEKTLQDLKTRISDTVKYLKSMNSNDFDGSAERKITTPRWESKHMLGRDYVIHHLLPNFYFHLTTAYSILRHNGVDIGKKDYLGELPLKT